MTVWKIPETLRDKYHGCGLAIGAVLNDQLVNIVYIADVLDDFDEFEDDFTITEDRERIEAAIEDPRLGPTVRQLQALGAVHVGKCSCYEFVEL